MQDKLIRNAITFDDVLLEPRFSDVVPTDCNVTTRLTKGIQIDIPLLSSPMDTVTEHEMAIALAREGGVGIIHKNMSVEQQADEVNKVKRSANGIITDPITLRPEDPVSRAQELMESKNVSGFPITDASGKLVAILKRRELRFLENRKEPIREVMTKDNLATARGTVTLEEAERILTAKKVEKLLLVDDTYCLTGIITIRDIDMMKRFPHACMDKLGRLRVGAAV